MIFKIIKDFFYSIRNIKIKQNTCLNIGSLKVKCHRCIEICPKNSIRYKNNSLIFDPTCDECGICAGVCPNGTISIQEPTEEKIFKSLLEGETLSCIKYKGKSSFKINCLACLTEDFVYGISILELNKFIINDFKECNHCIYSKVMKNTYFKYRLNALKLNEDLLKLDIENLNFECRIRNNLYDEDKREFLKSSFNYVKSTYIDLLNKYIKISDVAIEEKEFVSNKFIKTALNLLDINKKLELKIRNIKIPSLSAPCRFCLACEKLCPSKAITIEVNENRKSLILNTINCINCNICINICSYNSLKTQDITISDLYDDSKIITEIEVNDE